MGKSLEPALNRRGAVGGDAFQDDVHDQDVGHSLVNQVETGLNLTSPASGDQLGVHMPGGDRASSADQLLDLVHLVDTQKDRRLGWIETGAGDIGDLSMECGAGESRNCWTRYGLRSKARQYLETLGCSGFVAWTASFAGTGPMMLSRSISSIDGRTINVVWMLCPGGETQIRPSVLRPAVCSSATTTAPGGAPSSARRRALSMVDVVWTK